jgi:integrase
MYDEKYNGYIKPRIGTMKLRDVRDVHLQTILNEQAGKSESHLKKIRLVMQEMFRRARQSHLIVYDPAESLELPSCSDGARRCITEEERKYILALAKTHRSGLWILTLLYTGMRPGETAALTWGDIDFQADTIQIHAAKESGSTTIKSPKTKAGYRTLPHIHKELRPLLESAAVGKAPTDPVFPTGAGNFQNDNSIRRLWSSFKRDLDISMGAETHQNKIIKSVVAPDLVPYCLRHTFATDCARAGVPVDTVRWLMGHTDISVTANIYQSADMATMENGLKQLDGTAEEERQKAEEEKRKAEEKKKAAEHPAPPARGRVILTSLLTSPNGTKRPKKPTSRLPVR